MIRGTTPTIVLKFPEDAQPDFTNIEALQLTLNSSDHKLVVNEDRVTIDAENNTIKLLLTQQDTLAFNAGTIEIQIRIKFNNSGVWASGIKKTTMNRILEGGVI